MTTSSAWLRPDWRARRWISSADAPDHRLTWCLDAHLDLGRHRGQRRACIGCSRGAGSVQEHGRKSKLTDIAHALRPFPSDLVWRKNPARRWPFRSATDSALTSQPAAGAGKHRRGAASAVETRATAERHIRRRLMKAILISFPVHNRGGRTSQKALWLDCRQVRFARAMMRKIGAEGLAVDAHRAVRRSAGPGRYGASWKGRRCCRPP